MMPREPEEEKEITNEESEPLEELPEATMSHEEALEEAELNLEKALAEEKKRAEEYLAKWQRAQADFINYKRRVEQERIDFNSYANANLCNSILPVVDDLERAIAAIPEEYADSDWVEGVRLVEKKFKTILEGQGVKPICALGMAFDPNLHEAIRQEKGKEGQVVAEYLKGYMLNDKLLRPSRVAVGKGETEKTHKTHPKDKVKEAEETEKKEEEQNG